MIYHSNVHWTHLAELVRETVNVYISLCICKGTVEDHTIILAGKTSKICDMIGVER